MRVRAHRDERSRVTIPAIKSPYDVRVSSYGLSQRVFTADGGGGGGAAHGRDDGGAASPVGSDGHSANGEQDGGGSDNAPPGAVFTGSGSGNGQVTV